MKFFEKLKINFKLQRTTMFRFTASLIEVIAFSSLFILLTVVGSNQGAGEYAIPLFVGAAIIFVVLITKIIVTVQDAQIIKKRAKEIVLEDFNARKISAVKKADQMRRAEQYVTNKNKKN